METYRQAELDKRLRDVCFKTRARDLLETYETLLAHGEALRAALGLCPEGSPERKAVAFCFKRGVDENNKVWRELVRFLNGYSVEELKARMLVAA